MSGEAVESHSTFSTLSVVIPNFNYARFVGDTIRSALMIDWDDVEVIVVDDGSTDDSLAVLAEFGDQITVLRETNSGPRIACNLGFAHSRGEVVIFLDSDDLIDPSVAREVAAVWRPGVTKVQSQMRRIDEHGRLLPRLIPSYRHAPSPEQLRKWMLDTSSYPTPPGSGNVYARRFLEQIFPLDDSCGDATDSACLAAAPLLGDVITIPKTLASYRVHGMNRSSLRADPSRLPNQIRRAIQRHTFALRVAGMSVAEPVPPAVLKSRHLLQMRVADRRLSEGNSVIPGDSRGRLFADAATCLWTAGPESPAHRAAVSAWSLATLLLPMPLARWLIRRRFQ